MTPALHRNPGFHEANRSHIQHNNPLLSRLSYRHALGGGGGRSIVGATVNPLVAASSAHS